MSPLIISNYTLAGKIFGCVLGYKIKNRKVPVVLSKGRGDRSLCDVLIIFASVSVLASGFYLPCDWAGRTHPEGNTALSTVRLVTVNFSVGADYPRVGMACSVSLDRGSNLNHLGCA